MPVFDNKASLSLGLSHVRPWYVPALDNKLFGCCCHNSLLTVINPLIEGRFLPNLPVGYSCRRKSGECSSGGCRGCLCLYLWLVKDISCYLYLQVNFGMLSESGGNVVKYEWIFINSTSNLQTSPLDFPLLPWRALFWLLAVFGSQMDQYWGHTVGMFISIMHY